jgi:hypothetical protein
VVLKKASLTWLVADAYNIPLNLWLVAIIRKQKQHNQDRCYSIQESQGKRARCYNIQKSQEKTSTTKTHTTHNEHSEDRRYNNPLNLLMVATGCNKDHLIWDARCIVGAWVFCDKKVAHVLQRQACRWVEPCSIHSAVYPEILKVLTLAETQGSRKVHCIFLLYFFGHKPVPHYIK